MKNKQFGDTGATSVGAVHISEIEPTLKTLENRLGIDLLNNTLGSVGKRQFSGDIDVAVDCDPAELLAKLKAAPEILDTAQSSVIMTKMKIQEYQQDIETDLPRTGYAQVDFMFGDPSWLKTYYHSPSETESNYKGVYRNLMLVHICANIDRHISDQKVNGDQPIQDQRWMFSPKDGLVRVLRTPVPRKNGTGYTRRSESSVLKGPYKTAEQIVDVLNLGTVDALNSYESLCATIKQRYPSELWAKILLDFKNDPVVQSRGVPLDLIDLEPVNDVDTAWAMNEMEIF
jgi:hypothetical protein